ncbi:MAG: mechanosensitive ion channel [Nanohaloarchaea archaeon]|nr:mechanosensitive ion channel [Candidatus Nanohaloarchaea archaeon]
MSLNETITEYITILMGTSPDAIESSIITAVFILFASFVLALIINFIFEKIFTRFTVKTKFSFDDLILSALKRPIFNTVILAGTYTALEIVYASGKFLAVIDNILLSIMIIIWIFAAIKVNKIIFEHIVPKMTEKTKSDMDDEILPLLKSISNIILIFIGLMILMKSVWSFDITPLLASAGVLGFAVAFAAKDAISQLFGGISIYFDRPFKKGDRIEIGAGEIGIVDEIGLRSTRIRNFYNNMIIIPNSQIANSKIVNYNYPNDKMMVKIMIGVAYGSDVTKVKKVLLQIANSVEEVIDNPAPSIRFDNHGESSLDFAMIMWVHDPKDKMTVRDKVNTAIDKEFRKNKIDIPFPTRTIIQKR